MSIVRTPVDCASVISFCDITPQQYVSCPVLTEKIDDLLKACVVNNIFPEKSLSLTSAFNFPMIGSGPTIILSHAPIPPSPDGFRKSATDYSAKYSAAKPRARTATLSRGKEKHKSTERFIQLQKMLAQAKKLMTSIKEFDKQFEEQNHRPPKRQERQPIADKVEQYKNIRNSLRNCAATIIQSTWRRYQAVQIAAQKRVEKDKFLHAPLPIIEERLTQKRKELGRDPLGNIQEDDINAVREEKMLVKSELKRFDRVFALYYGKQPERTEKEPLRKLYQRYKALATILNNLQKQGGSGHADSDDNDGRVQPGSSPTMSASKPSKTKK